MHKIKKKTIKCGILSNAKVAKDHYVMQLEAPYLAKKSLPGQFVSLKVRNEGTDPLIRIPLGVHSIEKKGISVLYKVVGEGTDLLRQRRKGEKIDVLGPLGNGFDLDASLKNKGTRAFLVSGGHGIAPLHALAKEIKKRKVQIDFFAGACSRNELVCLDKIKKMGVKVHVATEDGTCGCAGYVTIPLLRELEKHLNSATCSPCPVVYACGPRPMLAAVAKEAKKAKIKAQVSVDAYMACGIGACLGCAIRTKEGIKMVCKDGPVFDADSINWKEEG